MVKPFCHVAAASRFAIISNIMFCIFPKRGDASAEDGEARWDGEEGIDLQLHDVGRWPTRLLPHHHQQIKLEC
jgi:hypothetical protein